MPFPSRRDILRASGLAVAASIAGCFGDQAPSEAASPTPGRTATPSAHRTGTEYEKTDTETRTADSATTPEESETPHETTHETPPTDESTETGTRTPDCTLYDITVHNETSRRISVSLRILEGWEDEDDEDDDDPGLSTPTPTPTPNVVFEDSFRLGSDEWQKYDDLPDREGKHRLEVDVEDRPKATRNVQASDWEGTSMIMVEIESSRIRFSEVEQGRRTECVD